MWTIFQSGLFPLNTVFIGTLRHSDQPACPRHCWAECWRTWRVLLLRRCCSCRCSYYRGSLLGSLSSTWTKSWSCRRHSTASAPAAWLMDRKRRRGTKKWTLTQLSTMRWRRLVQLLLTVLSPITHWCDTYEWHRHRDTHLLDRLWH